MFELNLAFRFLKEGRLQTILILTGIVIGVAVLIFLNALIGGLQEDLLNQTVGNSPHITGSARERIPISTAEAREEESVRSIEVSPREDARPFFAWTGLRAELEEMEGFKAVSPIVDGSGFITVAGTSRPVAVKSVEAEKADGIYNLAERMVAGEFRVGRSQILLGKDLAEDLRVNPGGAAVLTTAAGNSINVTLSGIFDLGNKALNSSLVFLELSGGQTLFAISGGISGIEMQVPDVFAADKQTRELDALYPELNWVSWQEENADLLSALNSQSASSYVIQAFVLLAVAMGISSVLAVSVIQRSKQIGILKALGIATNKVSRVFLLQGAILGSLGALLGSALGAALVSLFFLLVRDDQGEALFPITLEPQLFLFALLVATFSGMAAAWIPARRAARLDPVEVIKNG